MANMMQVQHPCLLSVVIPTHNRRSLVLRAVQSVLDQRRAGKPVSLEVIVVDDASTDDTAHALSQQYHDDARVTVLYTTRRHACGARNAGFAAAHGDYVCFLDSDDYWLPGTLANLLEVFARHPRLAFASVDGSTLATPQCGATPWIVASGSPGWSHAGFPRAALASERFMLAEESVSATLLHGDFFPAIINGDLFYLSGLLMRRDSARAAGPFNERFRFYNDWEFFARLCLQGDGAYLAVDGFRRDSGRPDQISRNRPATAMARRHLFIVRSVSRQARARRYAAQLERALHDACYRMARALAAGGRVRWARRYLLRSLRARYKMGRCLAVLAGWR